MKIIEAGHEWITPKNREAVLKRIEEIARVCYKSENNINDESASKMVSILVKNGHEAMIEHICISIKFICDRGVSHEIVRHRIASYAQESTRFCNYANEKFGNEITVIKPPFENETQLAFWTDAMRKAEHAYFSLLNLGCKPQIARDVLPISVKTEIVCTYNLREWRNFFKLRVAKDAHPQMRSLVIPLLNEMKEYLPEIFGDIEVIE